MDKYNPNAIEKNGRKFGEKKNLGKQKLMKTRKNIIF